MSLDTAARKVAYKTINKFGKSLVLTRLTVGTYDTATATATNTTSTTNFKAVVEEWAQTKRAADGISGTGLAYMPNDKVLTIAALGFSKPLPGDTIPIDGETFTIPEKGVETVYSGELAALYIVVARKA
jgi:hypothetical protein